MTDDGDDEIGTRSNRKDPYGPAFIANVQQVLAVIAATVFVIMMVLGWMGILPNPDP